MIRSLSITPEQASHLTAYRDALVRAERDLTVAFTLVIAGHGLAVAELDGIGGTPKKPTLDVSVPE